MCPREMVLDSSEGDGTRFKSGRARRSELHGPKFRRAFQIESSMSRDLFGTLGELPVGSNSWGKGCE